MADCSQGAVHPQEENTAGTMNSAAGSAMNEEVHNEELDVFENTVDTCRKQIETLIDSKTKLKKKFFKMVRAVMYASAIFFCLSIIASFVVFIVMAVNDYQSVSVITGAVTTLMSSFATLLLSIYKLPEIIATYLFDKEENGIIKDIIKTVQEYERALAQMKHEEAVHAAMSAVGTELHADSSENHNLSDSPNRAAGESPVDRTETVLQQLDSEVDSSVHDGSS